MTDFRQLSAKEALEILLSLEHPTVLMHVRPDGDAVGSASALALILSSLGKDVSIICQDPIPERLAFLTKGIKVAESAEDRELVSIDVASPTQLGTLSELSVRIMIDHHAKGTPFADNYIIPDASSAAEVLLNITDELARIGKFTMTKEIAARIYAAMSSDTGGFIYSNASPDTYRKAATLMETGIDYADINHRLFNSKSEDKIKAEGYIASKLKTALDGEIAYATLSREERRNLGISTEHFDTAIDVIRALYGARVALFVRELDDGSYRASLRSTGPDVASVAEFFGGGGHIRAAGCTPTGTSIEEAKDAVIAKLCEALKK